MVDATVPKFTDAQLDKANSISIIDIANVLGYNLRKTTNGSYKIPDFVGLYITPSGDRWYWVDRYKSGRTIEFLMEMKKITLVEAIETLLTIIESDYKENDKK